MNYEQKLIQNIFAICTKKGFRQGIIPEAVGLEKSAGSKLKNGTRRLDLNWLPIIATALGVSVVDIITYPAIYKEVSETEEEMVSITFQVPSSKRSELINLVRKHSKKQQL